MKIETNKEYILTLNQDEFEALGALLNLYRIHHIDLMKVHPNHYEMLHSMLELWQKKN